MGMKLDSTRDPNKGEWAMRAGHAFGKVLWQQKVLPRLLAGDMEDGLNFVRDWLEEAPNNPVGWEVFQHLYGAGPHANTPILIGNDQYNVTLRNPVGLAAGFTDARGLLALDATGLGFMNIKTIPLLPQYGNAKPRFFGEYLEEDDLLTFINRFGFDATGGIDLPVRRVQKVWDEYGTDQIKANIIWSFGPNKATMERYEETLDLQPIADDIVFSFARAIPVIRHGRDMVAFNVTSPNTRGLRALLDRFPELLELVIGGIRRVAALYHQPPPSCAVKLSPDMPAEQMRHVARSIRSYPEIIAFEGFNTTVDERIRAECGIKEAGGISGDRLEELAHNQLILLDQIMNEENVAIARIGIGGIMQPQHALDRLSVGEEVVAVELLTGLFKNGFSFVSEIQEALTAA